MVVNSTDLIRYSTYLSVVRPPPWFGFSVAQLTLKTINTGFLHHLKLNSKL